MVKQSRRKENDSKGLETKSLSLARWGERDRTGAPASSLVRERQLEDYGSQPSFLKTTPSLARCSERDRAGAPASSLERETVGGSW